MSNAALSAIDDAVRALNRAKAALETPLAVAIDAASMQRAHRLRADYFGEDLFCDPAWEILLELRVREQLGKPVSVSAAFLTADIPLATGLRHLARLEALNLVVREPDRNDARRVWLRLSDDARQTLTDYFSRASIELVR